MGIFLALFYWTILGEVRPIFLGIQLPGNQLPGVSFVGPVMDLAILQCPFRSTNQLLGNILATIPASWVVPLSGTVSVEPSFVGPACWEFQLSSNICEFHISGRNFFSWLHWTHRMHWMYQKHDVHENPRKTQKADITRKKNRTKSTLTKI